jgi:hypothetical protein
LKEGTNKASFGHEVTSSFRWLILLYKAFYLTNVKPYFITSTIAYLFYTKTKISIISREIRSEIKGCGFNPENAFPVFKYVSVFSAHIGVLKLRNILPIKCSL